MPHRRMNDVTSILTLVCQICIHGEDNHELGFSQQNNENLANVSYLKCYPAIIGKWASNNDMIMVKCTQNNIKQIVRDICADYTKC